MSNLTNKYFSFPNSTINSFKESFNKFLSDMKETSVENLFSNPKFKQLYDSVPHKWILHKPNGNIIVDTHRPETVIYFSDNVIGSGVTNYQSLKQDLVMKLSPNTEYMISIEMKSTSPVTIRLMGNATNIENNSTTFIKTSDTFDKPYSDSSIVKGYFFFRTPQFISGNYYFSIENYTTNNTVTIHSLVCQRGLIEFFDTPAKDFFIESSRYGNHWELTNDGTHYQRILLDGDIEPIMVDGYLKDHFNNVYYNVDINNEVMSIVPSAIITTPSDTMHVVDENFVHAYNGFKKCHINTNATLVYMYDYATSGWVNTSASDGLHIIPDLETGKLYRITSNNLDEVVLYQQTDTSLSSCGAERFYISYNIEHSTTGEHVFDIDANTKIGKALKLTVDPLTGVKTHSFIDCLKYENINENTDTSLITDMYFNTNNVSGYVNVFHDENGNHIIRDFTYQTEQYYFSEGEDYFTDNVEYFFLEGQQYYLEIRNGSLDFRPKYSSIVTDELFEQFTLEHDINGNHVIRGDLGFFYKVYFENGVLKFTRSNMYPIQTKEEMLDAWNKEHDIYGRHVFEDISDGKYYSINSTGDIFEYINNVKEYHHDNIASKFAIEHFINTDISELTVHNFNGQFNFLINEYIDSEYIVYNYFE